jgi:hypothetical protein
MFGVYPNLRWALFKWGIFLFHERLIFLFKKNYNPGICSSGFFSKGMSDMGEEGSISVFG